jgi:hypothetical protein
MDSEQHAAVQAGTDEAAAGGDTSDPAEGGIRCSQATSHMDSRDDSFEIRIGRQTTGPVASQDMRQGVRLVGTDAIA